MKDMMLKWWIRMEHAAMGRIRETAERFHRDKDGAGVAEYAMVVGLAVVLGVVILNFFWGEIRAIFDEIVRVLRDAIFQ